MIRHDSQRGFFAYELYQQMDKNPNIHLICCDLGWKVFDAHFQSFYDRCLNPGAAEQGALDIAIGLSLSGKIPVVYSITPFLLYRPFEAIRTYINHEKINVKLIGSGRDNSYLHDGYSHDATDAKKIVETLPNIKTYWPEDKNEVTKITKQMISDKTPCFLSLKR